MQAQYSDIILYTGISLPSLPSLARLPLSIGRRPALQVLRLFKLGKYASGLQMFARTLAASVDALCLLGEPCALVVWCSAAQRAAARRGAGWVGAVRRG